MVGKVLSPSKVPVTLRIDIRAIICDVKPAQSQQIDNAADQ